MAEAVYRGIHGNQARCNVNSSVNLYHQNGGDLCRGYRSFLWVIGSGVSSGGGSGGSGGGGEGSGGGVGGDGSGGGISSGGHARESCSEKIN